MTKKKNNNTTAKAALPGVPAAPRKRAARKPRAKAAENSELKKTILSAPRAVKLEAASSFMRTTAFTLPNKVRTAMTDLSKIENSSKTPSARLGLSSSSVQPTSSNSFFSRPFNRFKIAFATMVVIGGIAGSFYFDRVIDGFKSAGDAVSHVASDQTWVDGMLTQPNGIPEDNDKDGTLLPPRMMEETVLPVADEAPQKSEDTTDVLPTEPAPSTDAQATAPAEADPLAPAAATAPAPVPAAKAAAPEAKAPQAAKPSKKSKAGKAKSSKTRKAKARSKTKAANR